MSAVREALAKLKFYDFLDWMRRTEPVEDPEPGGQYVRQIPNAYIFALLAAGGRARAPDAPSADGRGKAQH